MANPLEQCAKVFTSTKATARLQASRAVEESVIYRTPIFGSAIATTRNREVVKAFGGVLNGLDGNFGPEFEGPKDERQNKPVLAFSISAQV